MRNSVAVGGGLASILATGIAVAVAQEREPKMLVWSHFVTASDDELRRQFEEFGKQAGVKVRMDRVAHLQLPGEVQGQKGHDLVNVSNSNPHLYGEHLEDITEHLREGRRRRRRLDDRHHGQGAGRQAAHPALVPHLLPAGDGLEIRIGDDLMLTVPGERERRYAPHAGRTLELGIRPEHITNRRHHSHDGFQDFEAGIKLVEPMGMDTMVFFDIAGTEVCARCDPKSVGNVDATMGFTFDKSQMHLIDPDTEKVV